MLNAGKSVMLLIDRYNMTQDKQVVVVKILGNNKCRNVAPVLTFSAAIHFRIPATRVPRHRHNAHARLTWCKSPLQLPNMSTSSNPLILMAASTESAASNELPTPEETLASFFASRGYPPPHEDKLLGETLMSTIQKKANEHLSLIGKTWESLDDEQQIKMAYIIIHEQDVRSSEDHQRRVEVYTARSLYTALDGESAAGKRLRAFVPDGGDISSDVGSAILEEFLSSHPVWRDAAAAPTIFNNPDEQRRLEPLFHFQGESPTCCLMVAANLIQYSLALSSSDLEQSQQSRRNVNRFLRNNFTNDEIFRHVYDDQGGSVFDHLGRLLKPSNPGPEVELYRSISIRVRDGVDFVYRIVSSAIRDYGALLIPNLKVIPAFASNNGKTHFSCDDFNEQAILESTASHSVLVVGVRTTEAMDTCGGLEFLIQNSWSYKPFVVVGYDVLLAMKVEPLWALAPGLKLNPGDDRVELAAGKFPRGRPLELFSSLSLLTRR